MVELSSTFIVIINLGAFVAFATIGFLFLYIGKSTDTGRKLTMPWINLFFGIILIGLNYLIQAVFPSQILVDSTITISSYLLIISGAAITFTSFVILYTQRSNEIGNLQKRHNELTSITHKLQKKFMSRQLPEDEMKRLNTGIVKELAEIEVKLDELKKKAPEKGSESN